MSFIAPVVIIALLAFLVLSAVKFAKYSKWSTHSRFDLYPVPKEKGRGEYGGSFYEEDEWWTKERKVDHAAEMIDVMKEMIFIRKLFISQRNLWIPSFLFHGGIYVLMAWSICLFIPAFWPLGWVVSIMSFVGSVGFAMATVGAAWLLILRLTREDLRVFTTPQDYFNLILILVVLCTGIYCWTAGGYNVFEVARQCWTFSLVKTTPILVFHLIALSALMIYIPVSKMGHYAGKFFCFRSVFWDNNPNTAGSDTEKKMKAAGATPVTTKWSAPHAQPAPAKDTEE
jgi:nitrate reductase gamma subunit